jgi:hypothetical protein
MRRKSAIGYLDSRGFAALALYALVSIALFGRGVIGNFTDLYLGHGVDATFLMWALTWWPHAIRHGLNPFLCKLVWAPEGFNLAWSGGLPLAALAAAPLTAAAGPVASYNTLCVIAPIAAAWAAYLLCRRLSGSHWPALLGGYVFGFSPYVLGQLADSHLNLILVFPIPLIALIALHGLTQECRRVAIVTMLAAAFVAQFLFSIELATTSAIFGALTLLVGWLYADDHTRVLIKRFVLTLAGAGGVASLALAPYLYYIFQPGAPLSAVNSPGGYSADLVNLVIPTRTAQVGLFPIFQLITQRFPGNLGERDAYLGLPLLMLVGHFGWKYGSDFVARLLVTMFALILLCALGPRLRLAGWTGFGLPWKLAMHVPLIKHALPGRFTSYAFLIVAIITARWLADSGRRRTVRLGVAALIIASTLPDLNSRDWVSPVRIPAFFADGLYRQQLRPGETIVALPFGIAGGTMLWQAASRMYFPMAGGYTGITPREFERWPVVRALMTHTYLADTSAQLIAFMAAHAARLVVVDDADQKFWASALAPIDPAPRAVGGVWLYRANAAALDQYRDVSALAIERRDADARFAAELAAARDYLAAGYRPAALTPLRAQQLGLLPPNWVTDPDVRTGNGLYLGPWRDDRVAVGIVGSYDALQPLIARYQGRAVNVYFPFPKELNGSPQGDTFMRLLVMVFDRATLINLTPRDQPVTAVKPHSG